MLNVVPVVLRRDQKPPELDVAELVGSVRLLKPEFVM